MGTKIPYLCTTIRSEAGILSHRRSKRILDHVSVHEASTLRFSPASLSLEVDVPNGNGKYYLTKGHTSVRIGTSATDAERVALKAKEAAEVTTSEAGGTELVLRGIPWDSESAGYIKSLHLAPATKRTEATGDSQHLSPPTLHFPVSCLWYCYTPGGGRNDSNGVDKESGRLEVGNSAGAKYFGVGMC
ncbi:hypothetical protein P691DRAFT_787540 [Macrolepiota fuliginosa MF-IS2]|uniref:Uncharacterized protein n=1 Tax=Macrolepiota fuliginosa MF-IS2 TaxID=1400762 RepID=A0A9P5X3L4_9AGAR|nr:hypothetical protein P691DRAFT_787540 [Macrolepiota fuliginosa MF-IS2]